MKQLSKNLSRNGSVAVKKWYLLYSITWIMIMGVIGILLQISMTNSVILEACSAIFYIICLGLLMIDLLMEKSTITVMSKGI